MGFTPPSRRLAHMRYSLFSLPPHRTVASLHRRRHYRFHSTKSYIWSGSLDFPSQSDALKRKLNQTQPNHTTSRTWAKIFTWNPKNQLNLKKITHTILNTTQSCYPANDQIVGASTPPPLPTVSWRRAVRCGPKQKKAPWARAWTSVGDHEWGRPRTMGCSAGSVWTCILGILSLALAFTVMIWLALTFYVLIVTIFVKIF
jgi:hypothetical protein